MSRIIEVDDLVTVGSLAETLELPVTKLITELMKNGVMATVNEKIDYETASIIVGELGLDVTLNRRAKQEVEQLRVRKAVSEDGVDRPPVVAVMGHVDHGKTSLLDAIRGTKVVDKEAGGITQHISAYQITHKNRLITFLDTPGHESFAALREHGAQLTDAAIIVVAADDGIKPQTIEAIRFARKAGVKIIVAINKMDKPGANPNLVKQQLSEQNLLIEEWGGDIVVVEVSAKTGMNVDKLLDMVFLVTDLEELKADESIPAEGLIIESHMEQGRGPVAIALVEQGTLRVSQFVVAGGAYAKIRTLQSTDSKSIKEAKPSTPVIITGFKSLPEFGDAFHAVKDERTARLESAAAINSEASSGSNMSSSELIRIINKRTSVEELNVIIKADVQGSLTSVIDSLKTLDNDEVAIKIVGSGVGPINDGDIHMATTSRAIIYGFNVEMPVAIKKIAARDKTPIRLYRVIYELIDDAKAELSKMLAPEVVETELGRLVVKGVFKVGRDEIICGGEVTKGKLTAPALARIVRDKENIAEVELTSLKRGQTEAKEIVEGEMCGVQLSTKQKLSLKEGDHVEVFTRTEVKRSL